jgi:hypothetical protein
VAETVVIELGEDWSVEPADRPLRPRSSRRPLLLTAVDPSTGLVAWRTARWQDAVELDGDRLLTSSHQVGVPMGVLDVRTGRTVGELTEWTVVPGALAPGVGLLVRPDTGRYGRFWFGVTGSGDSIVRNLGYVPRVISENCLVIDDLLACQTLRHTVQVWRYRT